MRDVFQIGKNYRYLIILSALFVSLILFFDNKCPDYYKKLFLLPLVFAGSSYLVRSIYDHLFSKLSITIIIGLYFVRMVIIPLIIRFSGYSIIIGGRDQLIPDALLQQHMLKAILLMCYETILVFFLMSKFKFDYSTFFTQTINFKNKSSILFKEVILCIVLFCGISAIIYPDLFSYTEFLMSDPVKTNYKHISELHAMKVNTPSLVYWLYLFFFHILQVFIPILLIDKIYKRLYLKNRLISLLLSFVVLLALFTIMTPEKATSVQLGFTLFIVLCMVYPKPLRLIAPITAGILGSFVILALLFKSNVFSEDVDSIVIFSKMSGIFNAYFGGPANVASSLCIEQKVNASIIIADLFNSTPFVGYFFQHLNNSPKIFNALIHSEEEIYLIIPMIGQGWFYFGFVCAPIITLIVVYAALWFERMANRTQFLIKKYIYIYAALLLSMAPVMYNLNIFISSFWTVVFCLIILALAYARLYSSGKLKYRL